MKGAPRLGHYGSEECAEEAGQAELVLQKGRLGRVVRMTFQPFH